MSRQAQFGFTLLEVLVALAVIAIALASLIKGAAGNSANAAYLRDRSLSQWVAMNVIAEQKLQAPDAQSRDSGTEKMGGHLWYWSLQRKDTFDKSIKRVEVSVAAEQEGLQQPVTTLFAFVPAQAGQNTP
jgi:general secretion pathway protein I